MNWFFETDGDAVYLSARLEDGETLGDARTEVRTGEDFYGVSYDALHDAGTGVVEINDGIGRIVPDED